VVLANFTRQFGGVLWSVDSDIDAVNSTREAIAPRFANLVHGDPVEFLTGFPERIDLLYLNSAVSSDYTMAEATAAMDHLAEGAVILIDDCDPSGGDKYEAVVPYFEGEGFEVLTDDVQVLMAR
jgi:hypothetical protein